MIQVGLGRYTWQTLNVKYFCTSCRKMLKTLDGIVSQVHHMGKEIQKKVSKIESFYLFYSEDNRTIVASQLISQVILKVARNKKQKSETPDDFGRKASADLARKKKIRIQERHGRMKSCLEYYHNIEIERNKKIHQIQALYESIGPTMIKLESLILGTFTGKSEKMNHYYMYWEKQLFTSLINFTTKNLRDYSDKLMSNHAMFEIDAILAAPDIIMKPASHELYNIMIHSVKDFLERYFFIQYIIWSCKNVSRIFIV